MSASVYLFKFDSWLKGWSDKENWKEKLIDHKAIVDC